MIVQWQVDDKCPIHFLEINESDIKGCLTYNEAIRFILEKVEMDYDHKVTWFIKNNQEIVDKIKAIFEQ